LQRRRNENKNNKVANPNPPRLWRNYDAVDDVMEGNLNQYMSLQGEHDAEERRSDRTLEESYMLEDDGLYDQEFPVSDNDPKDWNKSSGRRPSAMAKLAPETQNLCQAIQSLEKTINAHCQLLNRKSRGTIKSDSSRMGQALNSGSSVVRGDKVGGARRMFVDTSTRCRMVIGQ